MKPSTKVSIELMNVLQRELGAGYRVLVEPVVDSINGIHISGRPHFVVFDRTRGSTTIIQVNGSWLADELPIAAASSVFGMRNQNRELHPRMVLVSTSRVDRMIRDELAGEGVEVIVTDQPAEAVSRVTSLIRAAA